jgi:hypothetical protein
MKVAQFKKLFIKERDHMTLGLDLLFQSNCLVWRQNTGVAKYTNKDGTPRFVKYGLKGMPDVVGYRPEQFNKDFKAIPVFWECKKQGARLRKEQKEFIEDAKRNGCFAVGGTFDDLKAELIKWGWFRQTRKF